jgi:aryl-phospho-beta-D-glucosidase BglC (GH1 family)
MTISNDQLFFWVSLMLAAVCLYELSQRIKPFEMFVDDSHSGRWVLEHVDPAWGNAGLLIPVVRDGGGGGAVTGGGAVGGAVWGGGAMMPVATVPAPAPVAIPMPAAAVPVPVQIAPAVVPIVPAPAAVVPAVGPTGTTTTVVEKTTAISVTPVETTINFAPGKAYTAKDGNIYYGDEIVYICGINWAGIESSNNPGSLQELSIADHVGLLKKYGFNAVRFTMNMPAMLDPDAYKPENFSEGKNPDLKSMTVGGMLDKIISLCAEAGILVMLNMYNLKMKAELGKVWYDAETPESKLLEAWKSITTRYLKFNNVFAMDILNEPHGKPDDSGRATWGDGSANDFALWCEKAGNAILEVNPNLLICAGGVEYMRWGDNVSGAAQRPITLTLPNKVFYSPHIYQLDPAWLQSAPEKTFEQYLDKVIGEAVRAGHTVVIGEYGYTTDPDAITRDAANDKYYSVASQQQYIEDLTAYCTKVGVTNAFYWSYNHDGSMDLSIHKRNSADGTLSLVPGKLEQIMKLQSKKTWIKFVAE